jgi:hypothetical protein
MVGHRRELLAAGALGLCLVPALVACGGRAAAEPTPRLCSPESSRAGCRSARIGVEYALSLYAHCGVGHTYFDGRFWIVEPTQPHGANSIDGTMTLVAPDLAMFHGAGVGFAFKPAPSSFAPPSCY